MGIETVVFVTVVALAGHALSKLLAEENGPLDIFVKFREFIGITEEVEEELEEGNRDVVDSLGVLGKMFICGVCSSTAVTLLLAVVGLIPYLNIIPIILSPVGLVYFIRNY